MLGVKAKVKADTRKVKRKVQKGSFDSVGRAGAYVRGVARRSIKRSPQYAPAGHQPHTRRGKLKDAIFFATERKQTNVVIGPVATRLGQIGKVHEHGGRHRIRKKARKNRPAVAVYPKRPFMRPALEIARPKIPTMWSGSVKE